MKIVLRKQTTWGCVRHFSVYKNGVLQGKLFNSLSTELEVEAGDVLKFKDGFIQFPQVTTITPDTKEITIRTTEHIQQLFSLFILLFLVISSLCFSIGSMKLFLFSEMSLFLLLNQLFRYFSYEFTMNSHTEAQTFRLKSVN